MSKLKGKVAVVTGASKGIGAAIAKSLAAEGASVVVNYASSKAGADTVVAAITQAGGKAVAVGGDVSKTVEAQGIIDAAIKTYGRLDILVNNSGVYEFTPIETVTEEQWTITTAAARHTRTSFCRVLLSIIENPYYQRYCQPPRAKAVLCLPQPGPRIHFRYPSL